MSGNLTLPGISHHSALGLLHPETARRLDTSLCRASATTAHTARCIQRQQEAWKLRFAGHQAAHTSYAGTDSKTAIKASTEHKAPSTPGG